MNLADHPNQIVATTNDDEARALLSDLGVLHKLEQPESKVTALPNQVLQLDIWKHPTHWITATRYVGFSRPADNGYGVRCLPKSVISRAEFERMRATEKREAFPQGHTDQQDDLPPVGTN